jgi:hypothetical protein
MNTQSVIRFGGMAALVSATLYVVSIGLWMGAGESSAPPLAAAAYAVSSLIFLATLYALYVLHRRESAALSLAALLLLGVSMVASTFVDPTDLSNPIVLALTVCYGLGALLLGWLAYRSPQLPQGVAILALIMGVLSLAMLAPMTMGAAELVGIINLIVGLLYVVWLVWLGWILIKIPLATVQPA